jgi:hypothetical protein
LEVFDDKDDASLHLPTNQLEARNVLPSLIDSSTLDALASEKDYFNLGLVDN